jgi:hypothetical protein
MDIEKKILSMERMINCVPGTVLQRTLLPDNEVGWTLGLGCMQDPKAFFTGRSIKECIEKAEKEWGKK